MEFFIGHGTLGFFSNTFRLLETYMVCKRDSHKLYLNTSEWNFGHTLGWSDYFTTLSEKTDEPLTRITSDGEHIRQFTAGEYKAAMKELFVYQPYLIEKAEAFMKEHEMENFVAVFMRRGDKLLGESLFIPARYYVQLLLDLSPRPETVFIQTDDYRAFLEFKAIIHSISPSIRLITTCPETKHGMFFTEPNLNEGRYMLYQGDGYKIENSHNLQYLSTNIPQKPLIEYTKEEMREHVEEMLIGIIICQKAKYVALDHMSNVSRFIDFSHPRGKEAILSIEDLNIQITNGVCLIKRYDYEDDKLIRNPRYHSIYNEYI